LPEAGRHTEIASDIREVYTYKQEKNDQVLNQISFSQKTIVILNLLFQWVILR